MPSDLITPQFLKPLKTVPIASDIRAHGRYFTFKQWHPRSSPTLIVDCLFLFVITILKVWSPLGSCYAILAGLIFAVSPGLISNLWQSSCPEWWHYRHVALSPLHSGFDLTFSDHSWCWKLSIYLFCIAHILWKKCLRESFMHLRVWLFALCCGLFPVYFGSCPLTTYMSASVFSIP